MAKFVLPHTQVVQLVLFFRFIEDNIVVDV